LLHRYGFFDADCRELGPDRRSLGFRPRVAPLVATLEKLYAWIDAHGYPLVFTTCCSGSMPAEGQLPGVVHVPLEVGDGSWQQHLAKARRFYLAKKAYGDPKVNGACRAYDMFQDNANAPELVRALSTKWVVFGNGFDLCVHSAAAGILATGLSAIVLHDVRISSAGGTPESEALTLQSLADRGAAVMGLAQFLAGAD
jgi:nicotinamidase-related amidase